MELYYQLHIFQLLAQFLTFVFRNDTEFTTIMFLYHFTTCLQNSSVVSEVMGWTIARCPTLQCGLFDNGGNLFCFFCDIKLFLRLIFKTFHVIHTLSQDVSHLSQALPEKCAEAPLEHFFSQYTHMLKYEQKSEFNTTSMK